MAEVHYDDKNDTLVVELKEHDDVNVVKFQDWLTERRIIETNELVWFKIVGFRRMVGLAKRLMGDAVRMGENEWDEYIKDLDF